MKPLIRSAKESDKHFILSTWLRAYYDLMNSFHKPPHEVYFNHHQTIIKKLLQENHTYIVCSSDDSDQIMSYMTANKDTLHFIYTKNVFRNLGFARMLLNIVHPKFYTHHTSYIKHLKLGAIYNPYLGVIHETKDSQAFNVNQEPRL